MKICQVTQEDSGSIYPCNISVSPKVLVWSPLKEATSISILMECCVESGRQPSCRWVSYSRFKRHNLGAGYKFQGTTSLPEEQAEAFF